MTFNEHHLRLAILNEGLELKPYKDTVGKLTIGIGRNLDDVGISPEEARFLFKNDLKRTWDALIKVDPWVTLLDEVRQAAVLDLAFNLGVRGWTNFRRTRDLLAAGEYEDAATELAKSLWFRQVKRRGPRIQRMIVTGLWPWETDP